MQRTQPNKNLGFHQEQEIRAPRIDIFESPTAFYTRVSIPGVQKENLEIIFTSSKTLMIQGVVQPLIPKEFQSACMIEIYSGPFQREIIFPKEVKEKATIRAKSGILEILVQKK